MAEEEDLKSVQAKEPLQRVARRTCGSWSSVDSFANASCASSQHMIVLDDNGFIAAITSVSRLKALQTGLRKNHQCTVHFLLALSAYTIYAHYITHVGQTTRSGTMPKLHWAGNPIDTGRLRHADGRIPRKRA